MKLQDDPNNPGYYKENKYTRFWNDVLGYDFDVVAVEELIKFVEKEKLDLLKSLEGQAEEYREKGKTYNEQYTTWEHKAVQAIPLSAIHNLEKEIEQ